MTALLSIRNLSASFATRGGEVPALRDVSLDIGAGRIVGLIGESGSGKTVLAHGVMGILRPGSPAARCCFRVAMS